MSEINVTVRLFGAFRRYGDMVNFIAPAGCSGQEIKNIIASLLGTAFSDLVKDSALALDDEIISDGATFTRDCSLAILPPVCGG